MTNHDNVITLLTFITLITLITLTGLSHAPVPNCELVWEYPGPTCKVVALRSIRKGEVLSVAEGEEVGEEGDE
jgi:hypothetical protein